MKLDEQLLNAWDGGMLFQGDFTKYQERKDGIQYDVAFLLETKDGTIYVPQFESVASFGSTETSTHGSSGEGTRIPVFPQ